MTAPGNRVIPLGYEDIVGVIPSVVGLGMDKFCGLILCLMIKYSDNRIYSIIDWQSTNQVVKFTSVSNSQRFWGELGGTGLGGGGGW